MSNESTTRTIAAGDQVISPDTSPAWAPIRVTRAHVTNGGRVMIYCHRLASMGWMSADGFLLAPSGAQFTNGRWMRDGTDVTPKRADLPINRQ